MTHKGKVSPKKRNLCENKVVAKKKSDNRNAKKKAINQNQKVVKGSKNALKKKRKRTNYVTKKDCKKKKFFSQKFTKNKRTKKVFQEGKDFILVLFGACIVLLVISSFFVTAIKVNGCTDPQKLDQKSNFWRSVFLWLNIVLSSN